MFANAGPVNYSEWELCRLLKTEPEKTILKTIKNSKIYAALGVFAVLLIAGYISQSKIILVTALSYFIGLMLFMIVFAWIQASALDKRGVRTTATIVGFLYPNNQNMSQRCTVEFIDSKGNTVRSYVKWQSGKFMIFWTDYKVGEKLTVLYDPEDPQNVAFLERAPL